MDKCCFCDAQATKINRIIVETKPEEEQGLMHYDYHGGPIYTCDRHKLICIHGDMKNG